MGMGDWALGIGDWGLGIGPKSNFTFKFVLKHFLLLL